MLIYFINESHNFIWLLNPKWDGLVFNLFAVGGKGEVRSDQYFLIINSHWRKRGPKSDFFDTIKIQKLLDNFVIEIANSHQSKFENLWMYLCCIEIEFSLCKSALENSTGVPNLLCAYTTMSPFYVQTKKSKPDKIRWEKTRRNEIDTLPYATHVVDNIL